MGLYLDERTKTLWDKRTLEEYELSDDCFSLLHGYLSGSMGIDAENMGLLRSALEAAGIDISQICLLNGFSRTLQTPVVHIIRSCNSRCLICDCWKTRLDNFIDAADLRQFWTEAKKCGAQSVMLTGGEPLLHPQLLTIIQDAHDAGLGVELNMNAIMLDGEMRRRLSCVDALIVSIDGFTSDDYKMVRGVDALQQVAENVLGFTRDNEGVLVGIRCTVTNGVLSHLKECVSFAEALGVDVVSFSPLDSTSSSFNRNMNEKRALDIKERFLPSLAEVESYLIDLQVGRGISELITQSYREGMLSWNCADFQLCLQYYKGVLEGKIPEELCSEMPCSFPRSSLVVDYDGAVLPCFYSHSQVDLKSFTSDAWNPLEFCRLAEMSGSCSGCRGKVFCGA